MEGRYFLNKTSLNNLNSTISVAFEYYYYYFFLLKLFSLHILSINSTIFKKFSKISNFFYLYFNIKKKNFVLKNFFDKSFKYKVETTSVISFNLNQKKNSLNKINNLPLTYFKLFNLFFLFNYSIFNTKFRHNFRFNFLMVKEFKKKIILININKFFSRWIDSYNLFYNIFFYNFMPLTFGSSLMKNEVLAINWYYSKFDINLWNYYFPFFIFKLNNYNKKSEYFFEKLYYTNINFFFIIDTIFHYKNLYYFKRYNYYTIGLVDSSLNPNLVSYPILNFFSSYNTQIFFFRLIIFIQKLVYLKKFCYFKNLWNQFYLSSFFFKIK